MNTSIEAMRRFASECSLSKKSIVESIIASVIVMVATELVFEYYDQQDRDSNCQIILYRKVEDGFTILLKQYDCEA